MSTRACGELTDSACTPSDVFNLIAIEFLSEVAVFQKRLFPPKAPALTAATRRRRLHGGVPSCSFFHGLLGKILATSRLACIVCFWFYQCQAGGSKSFSTGLSSSAPVCGSRVVEHHVSIANEWLRGRGHAGRPGFQKT